jgi:hypothetical protein
VEINATSGVAVFDDIVEANRNALLTINNTNIVAGSVLWLSLQYDNGASSGSPTILNYWTQNGSVTVEVYNLDAIADTAQDLSIAFQIVG